MYQFNAEVSKVLKLVIHSLYTNKDVFLRELISNSSDACEKLRYLSITNPSLSSQDYKIEVILNKDKKTITVKDNGIGMDDDDLINHLGTIAKSGTNEFFIKASNSKDTLNDLIGQFGVGFYSCFMISDKIEVRTKKAGNNKAYSWISDGVAGFDIIEIDDFESKSGTEVIVHIKETEQEVYLDKFRIQNIITTYSNHISVPIIFSADSELSEEINKGRALWLQDKKEIDDKDYESFYNSISYLPGKPFAVLHNKVEGAIEYTSLLFIPNSKPFDLYHPDRNTKVKLYVKHVFISEKDVNILPRYLRFIYGIIDSNDLPLNVSRETLQDNSIILKIKDSVEKRILNELLKNKNDNAEKYDSFWNNFGSIIKEGLCEGFSNREALMDLTKFHSSKSLDKLTCFSEYIARMPEKQKEIYYFIGEKKSDMLKSPEMEIFNKYDIEVIFLTDIVDSFWVNVIHDHKGKDLKNIVRADINLEDFKKDNESKEDKADKNEEDAEVIKKFMQALEGKVSAVKISTKLVDSPACLSINPGSMDIKMEQYLLEQKQLNKKSLKILEINSDHKLIQRSFELLNSTNSFEQGKKLAETIFEIALISHGEMTEDPSNFARKIVELIG
jgi:molecular chaperone HtpG